MTHIHSYFNVTDNSGVKKILCIRNLTRKVNKIHLGDLIVGVVKEINFSSKLIYSTIVYGIAVRLKKSISNLGTYNMYFNDNAAVLIDKNLNPIGSRIFGSIPKYLKEKNYLKLNSLTVELL